MADDETKVCPVCGAEVDFYGCLGEMRGRHVPIEMAALKADLKAALALAELNGTRLEECQARLAAALGRRRMRVTKHHCDRCKRDISDEHRYEVVAYVYSPTDTIQPKMPHEADLCGMCFETLLPMLRAEE